MRVATVHKSLEAIASGEPSKVSFYALDYLRKHALVDWISASEYNKFPGEFDLHVVLDEVSEYERRVKEYEREAEALREFSRDSLRPTFTARRGFPWIGVTFDQARKQRAPTVETLYLSPPA